MLIFIFRDFYFESKLSFNTSWCINVNKHRANDSFRNALIIFQKDQYFTPCLFKCWNSRTYLKRTAQLYMNTTQGVFFFFFLYAVKIWGLYLWSYFPKALVFSKHLINYISGLVFSQVNHVYLRKNLSLSLEDSQPIDLCQMENEN
jgi:hypothetical protein